MAWQKQSWSAGKEDDKWSAENRKYVSETRATGVLIDWKQCGGKSFGWIAPIHGIPEDLPESVYHGGDIYVHWKDIQEPRPGAVVTFKLYQDKQGLGADGCISRNVLRFALPRESVKALTLPIVEANPCAKYLTSSVFYPELEQKDVTLRKYLWDSPLVVYELWGELEAIITAAKEIGLCAHTEAEALVSKNMVPNEPADNLREIPATELSNVPPRFRVGLKLGGGADVDQRLRSLLTSA